MKIAFITSDKLLSRLIRWFTNSKWSHCLLILDDTLWQDAIIFEASLFGVRINFWSTYKDYKSEIYTIRRPASPKCLYKFIGKNYGYLQLVGDALVKIFRLKSNPFTADYVCSEIVLRFLKENDFKEFANLDANLASPEDLYKIIQNNENFRKD